MKMHYLHYIVSLLSMLVVLLDARLIVQVDEVPSKDPMYNCYLRYVSEPLEKYVAILYQNTDNVSEYIEPIQPSRIIFASGKISPDKRPYHFSNALVIIATSYIEVLQRMFYVLSRDTNARTRYLIVYLGKEPTDKIFELAWGVYISKIVVLRPGDTSVYTYFPYRHGECGERIRSEVLGQCMQLSLAALYPPKVPKVFHGCTFRITTHSAVPAVLDPLANTGDPLYDGYENVMVNSILERLNLSKRLNVTDSKDAIYANGTISSWSPLNNLLLNISDMCFSGMSFIDHTKQLCEASYVYHQEPLVWLAPVAGPGAQWMSVILVYQGSMWYAVLGFFLMNTFVWWIFGRTTNCWNGSYLECLLGSLLVLLNGSVPFPKRSVMRYLVASWTVCSLLVIAAYQCQFLSFLLKPVYEKQISNEQDIVESELPVILEITQAEALDIINQYYSEIIRKHAQVQTIKKYNHYIHHEREHTVFMQPLMVIKFLRMFNNSNNRPTVYVLKEPIYFWSMCFFFRRGHPMLDRWNELLMQFVESGLLGKFLRDVDRSPPVIPEEPEKVPINMHHLSSAFYILLFGYAAALLVFLFEQIVHKMKKTPMRVRRQR